MRQVADGDLAPAEAVKAYHAALEQKGVRPTRPLERDLEVTQPALKSAISM